MGDRPRSEENLDAIVVGAGHNGLVAGAYLARSGLRVLILERREVVGGLCATVELFPGIRGNLVANSAHNLEPQVVLDLELEKHGLVWSDEIVPSSFMMLPGGRRIVSWPDASDARAEFDRFASGDYDAHRRLLDDVMDLGQALDVPFFGPPPAFADVAARPMTPAQEDLFSKVMFGSAAELVSDRLVSEEARTSLGMLAAAGNYAGPESPGTAYQIAHRALYRSSSDVRGRATVRETADFASRAPIGGMGAIGDALAQSFVAAGGEIRTDSDVASIKVGPSRVEGVVLASGEEIDARTVVSAINPKTTVLDLVPPDALDPSVRSAFADLEMAGCMGKVHVALSGLPRFACARSDTENAMLARCGFRIGSTLETMQLAYETARRGQWSGEPLIYGLIQTAFDPTLAPDGSHLMSLSVTYAPYHLEGGDWTLEGDHWARHVLKHLAEHITNLDEIVDGYRFLTPLDLEDEFGLLEGHCLHGNVTVSGAFQSRPVAGFSDYRGPVSGLYFCSNGTWPANYVSGLPGRNAAQEVSHDLHEAAHQPQPRRG